MTFPAVAVNVSFGTGRFDTPSYTTLTAADVEAIDIVTGKQSELDGSNPGSLSVRLDNNDREFDPHNTAGAHYPNVTPGKKVQVTATYAGTTYEIFNGWTDGWPQTYGLKTGYATLKASGAFRFLARTTIPDPYEAAVLADSPTGWYRLGDSESHALTDSSGNGRHGHWGPEFVDVRSAEPLIRSADKAVELPAAPAFAAGKIPSSVVPHLRPMSIEFWIRTDRVPKELPDPLGFAAQLWTVVLSGGGPTIRIHAATGTYPGAVDFIVGDSDDISVANISQGTTRWYDPYNTWWFNVCDGVIHQIVCTIDSTGTIVRIWVDGVDLAYWTSLTGTVSNIPAYADLTLNYAGGWDSTAVIDELAFYNTELTSTQLFNHYEAGAFPGSLDTTGARVGRVLDLISWPASLRDVEAGQTVLGIATTMAGSKALDYLDVVTATEHGALTEAHHDTGKVRFQSRSGRLIDTRSSTVQTLFSDQASDIAGTAVVYSAIDLMDDDRPAANIVTVRWLGGDVTVTDQTSVNAYGEITPPGGTITTILGSRDEAESLAQFVLNEQSSLFKRVRSITLRPGGMNGTPADRAWVAALSRQEGDRVRVVHQPASTGVTIDQQLWIIGVEHHVSGVDWETTFHLSPAITTTYWILGTAQLGSGTRLTY